jgi:hypothetical protein
VSPACDSLLFNLVVVKVLMCWTWLAPNAPAVLRAAPTVIGVDAVIVRLVYVPADVTDPSRMVQVAVAADGPACAGAAADAPTPSARTAAEARPTLLRNI